MKKSAVGDRDDDVGGLVAVMVSCACVVEYSSSMLCRWMAVVYVDVSFALDS